MQKIFIVLVVLVVIAGLGYVFYEKNKTPTTTEEIVTTGLADTSQTSLDWAGTYVGVTPCADCEGIQEQLVLNPDNTYVLTYQYLETEPITKENGSYVWDTATSISESGTFTWNEIGTIITLDNTTLPGKYQVGENQLTQLDMDGNAITSATGSYVLAKIITDIQ